MNKLSLKTNKQHTLVQHIVCFKFLTNTSSDQVKLLEQSFFALQDKIPGVLKIDGGENNSPENLNKGLTHCFIITFEDEDARANYLPHPKHQEFVDQLKPILEDLLVIDFNSQN